MNISTISNIWDIIVKSNLFNFIVFVLILAWVFKKIDVASMIKSLQDKIIKIIDEVKKNHKDAKENLLSAEKSIEHLEEELEVIVKDAQKSADVISDKILTEAKKQLESIEFNAQRIIDAEEKMLISNLAKNTSKASIEHAQSHIKNTLAQTPSLHEKYINESIDELDRLNF